MKLHSSYCTHCGAELSVAAGNSSPVAMRRALRRSGAIVQRERGEAAPGIFCDADCRRKHKLKQDLLAAAKQAEMEDD